MRRDEGWPFGADKAGIGKVADKRGKPAKALDAAQEDGGNAELPGSSF